MAWERTIHTTLNIIRAGLGLGHIN